MSKCENCSSEYKKFIKRKKIKSFVILVIQIAILVFFMALWELLTKYQIMDTFFFSSPSRILKTLKLLFDSGTLSLHINTTLYEAFLAFMISTVVGTIIAILLWWNETIRRVLDPYIVVLNSLPKIALGPIIIIIVGVGTKAIVMMAVLIMIIITIISMLNSFLQCDKNKLFLLDSMGASKFQKLYKLVLPSSATDFIGVVKINVGLTWVGTIMGEYLTSKAGLGYLIIYGKQVFDIDLVMTSTVILCVLAGVMYFAVALIENRIKKTKKK